MGLLRAKAAAWLLLWAGLMLVAEAAKHTTAAADSDPWNDGEHKSVLPLSYVDLLTILVGAPALMIAAASGVGGGGLLVPLYILILGFDPKRAIALSNITILGGAITNVTLASSRRHPQRDRPLIDWSLIAIMEPIAILGAVLGSFLNKLLPPLVLTSLLVIMLGMLSHRTLTKGLATLKKEGGWREVCCGAHHPSDHLPIVSGSKDGSSSANDSSSQASYMGGGQASRWDQQAVQQLLERDRHVQAWQPALLSLVFVGVGGLQVVRDLFPCGSPAYWVAALSAVVLPLPFFFLIRWRLLEDYHHREAVGFPFLKTDVKWTPGNSLRWPLMVLTAGVMAGTFGIGGGMVKGPLMLEMGVLPVVSSATVATMILFTSASACVALFIFHIMPLDYALPAFLFGLLATALGQKVVAGPINRRHKQSVVILSLGAIMSLSVVMVIYQVALTLQAQGPSAALEFGSLCSDKPTAVGR